MSRLITLAALFGVTVTSVWCAAEVFEEKTIYLLESIQQPVEVDLRDSEAQLITVFREPGYISWQECKKQSRLCVAWPNRGGTLQVTDSRLVRSSDQQMRLFYQITFKYPTPQGVREGRGWVPAEFVKRKISGPSTVPTRPTEETNVAQELSLSGTHLEDLSKGFSRWVKPRDPASENAESRASAPSLLNLKVDFDLDARLGLMQFKKSATTGDQDVAETALRVGFAGIAPILLELEAAGSLEYAKGLTTVSGDGPRADVVSFEQHVLYTLPHSPPGAALKFGAGWNLIALTKGGDDYGMKAAAGLRLIGMFENPKGFFHGKLGPVANSSGVSEKNMQLSLSAGWRLKPELGYRGWCVTAEIQGLTITSKLNGDRSTVLTEFIGLRRTF